MNVLNQYCKVSFRKAWVMFDLSNGDSLTKKGYMWVFATKKEAIEHRRNQHKIPTNARLSLPIKIQLP